MLSESIEESCVIQQYVVIFHAETVLVICICLTHTDRETSCVPKPQALAEASLLFCITAELTSISLQKVGHLYNLVIDSSSCV